MIVPDFSFARVHAALVLPARLSVPTRTMVWHRSSGPHVALMHGNGSSLFPVSAIRVVEFSPGRMRGFCSADWFKILWVALKARIVSVRSRTPFLFFWLAIKPVTSIRRQMRSINQKTKNKHLSQCRHQVLKTCDCRLPFITKLQMPWWKNIPCCTQWLKWMVCDIIAPPCGDNINSSWRLEFLNPVCCCNNCAFSRRDIHLIYILV